MSNFFKSTAGKITIIVIVVVCVVAVFLAKNAVDKGTAQAESERVEREAEGMTELNDENLPVFVEVGADWCVYCEKMQPIIDELKEEYQGRVAFKYIDIDEEPEAAREYGVQGVPHYALIDESGEPALAFSGATTKEKLQQFIKEGVGIDP